MFQLSKEKRQLLIPCLYNSKLVLDVLYLDDATALTGRAWKMLDDLITDHLAANHIYVYSTIDCSEPYLYSTNDCIASARIL
jgi:hypothetical protein